MYIFAAAGRDGCDIKRSPSLDEGDLRGGQRRAKHLYALGLYPPVSGRGEEVEKESD